MEGALGAVEDELAELRGLGSKLESWRQQMDAASTQVRCFTAVSMQGAYDFHRMPKREDALIPPTCMTAPGLCSLFCLPVGKAEQAHALARSQHGVRSHTANVHEMRLATHLQLGAHRHDQHGRGVFARRWPQCWIWWRVTPASSGPACPYHALL